MKKQLTLRQEHFVKHVIAGKSATQAARQAGYSKKSARSIASKLLTNDNIRQHMEEILDKAGLSDITIAETLKTAIDSGLGKGARNSDSIKGVRIALELMDRFPNRSQKVEISHSEALEVQFINKLEKMTIEEINTYYKKLTEDTRYYLKKLKASNNEKF